MERFPRTAAFEPLRAATEVVRHFKMGAICPAEMWVQLADVLSQSNVNQILDALAPECQATLRESYRERPRSLWALRGNPLRRGLKHWCRGGHDGEIDNRDVAQ